MVESYMTEKKSFTYYQYKIKNKIKIKNFDLFSMFINTKSFCRKASLLFNN